VLATPRELAVADREWLEIEIPQQVFPVLTPLAIEPAHPFPFIPNLGFALALKLHAHARRQARDGAHSGAGAGAALHAPAGPRKAVRFVPLETVIRLSSTSSSRAQPIRGLGSLRILRDSDVEVEEEAEDLVLQFETLLKRRRRGSGDPYEMQRGRCRRLCGPSSPITSD
jgi:polyphosphate kinase